MFRILVWRLQRYVHYLIHTVDPSGKLAADTFLAGPLSLFHRQGGMSMCSATGSKVDLERHSQIRIRAMSAIIQQE